MLVLIMHEGCQCASNLGGWLLGVGGWEGGLASELRWASVDSIQFSISGNQWNSIMLNAVCKLVSFKHLVLLSAYFTVSSSHYLKASVCVYKKSQQGGELILLPFLGSRQTYLCIIRYDVHA